MATRSLHSNEAWNFIQFLARTDVEKEYINKTGRTPALVELLNEQIQSQDPIIQVFAQQAITAKSWYQGKSPTETEEIFGSMISAVLNGTMTPAEAAATAVQRAQTIY
ncbi:MAG: hypothetical protein A2840_01425 [Candidatus Buchananbacteria bacterium RIFCSPHIGHO2_01_FULL_47_11b]|uniref:ABC transporter substrate-binding protein n=1 Tax=Candidatus Buchananbacteria bacterium RIFCSPHIGHO2_01_FULL_47_11b TaxID=1797537 RepID=A0A1G1Y4T5_9BACT|nr:MAG: hypothetical protein A2840_01425 [Candidatus Buchananbacteria bacterium RIFCSPHIGHO2_01_FULL_47_11b]